VPRIWWSRRAALSEVVPCTGFGLRPSAPSVFASNVPLALQPFSAIRGSKSEARWPSQFTGGGGDHGNSHLFQISGLGLTLVELTPPNRGFSLGASAFARARDQTRTTPSPHADAVVTHVLSMRFSSDHHARIAEALDTAAREESDSTLAAEYARKAALSRVCAKLANLDPRLREPVSRKLLVKWGCHFLNN